MPLAVVLLLHCLIFFQQVVFTLKGPITNAADNIHKYFFHCFPEKIRLDVSSESSARQRIHMKNQALFSSKDKSKKLKCRLLQFLFGALRVSDKHSNFLKLLIFSGRVCPEVQDRYFCT